MRHEKQQSYEKRDLLWDNPDVCALIFFYLYLIANAVPTADQNLEGIGLQGIQICGDKREQAGCCKNATTGLLILSQILANARFSWN